MSTTTPSPPPTPTLLLPPGPAVRSIRILPSGITTDPTEHRPIPPLFYDALTIRRAVFGIEQNCSADGEIDADDEVSWHWVIHAPLRAGGPVVPAATIRLMPARAHMDAGGKVLDGPDYRGSEVWDGREAFVMIGRLATGKAFRGRGFGRVLVEGALRFAVRNKEAVVRGKGLGTWKGLVGAHAQVEKLGWYRGLGFVSDEGMGRWMEEGIEHVGIWRRVDVEG